MKNRDSFRGTSIDDDFAKAFKESCFYKDIYCKHMDEVIIGIRDGYINLYYNCDSIAKISKGRTLTAEISPFYASQKKLDGSEMRDKYEDIKEKSDNRNKEEKQAQQYLYIANNQNPNSRWFCIDIEYTKSFKGERTASGWRFDLIAISKEKPFRVALIELKYGNGALGGKSGIRKHIKDFYDFHKHNSFKILRPEIVSIISSLDKIGVEIPNTLKGITEDDFNLEPEYYFIILNNIPNKEGGSTPQQTISGYLFKDYRWGCKRVSSLINKEGDFYALTENDASFRPVFLFSEAQLPVLDIDNIIDHESYNVQKL